MAELREPSPRIEDAEVNVDEVRALSGVSGPRCEVKDACVCNCCDYCCRFRAQLPFLQFSSVYGLAGVSLNICVELFRRGPHS